MNPSRRRFLFSAAVTLVAAPAIVRVAANLMPVSTRVLMPRDFIAGELAFLEGMSQTMEQTIWYGEPASIELGMIAYTSALNGKPAFTPAFEVHPSRLRTMA